MPVKEIHVPRAGVPRTMLIVLSAALVAAALAACGDGPRRVPDNDSDRVALVAFYQSTNGLNWTNKANWLSDQQIGAWHGVTTDRSGRVTHLELRENGMTGQIPLELANLDNLVLLDLSFNRLSGPIPPELGSLGNLTSLYLHGNGLTGSIPLELGNLGSLTVLSLFANGLTGPIPLELGNLVNLRRLHLEGNRLSGRIPPELGNLVNLTGLSLNSNALSGQAPPEVLSNMTELTRLSLGENGLRGCVPSALRGQLTGAWRDLRGLPFCDEVPPPRPCAAGMTLKPGDYCTIDTRPRDSNLHPAWPYQLQVGDNNASLGRLWSADRIDREGFNASRNHDGSWTVHSAP